MVDMNSFAKPNEAARENDIAVFHSTLLSVSRSYPMYQSQIKNILSRMDDVLADRMTLEDAFTLVGYGAYKETYKLTHNTVIKFACEANATSEEAFLLNAADGAGVSALFIPTWFCPLESYHPQLVILDDNDDDRQCYDSEAHTYRDDPDWVGNRASHAIIQPRIDRRESERDWVVLERNPHDYYKHTAITDPETGEVIDVEVALDWCVSSYTWLQAVCDAYGADFFKRAAAFLKEHHVCDLHLDNIGYITTDGVTVPVIFDWLSHG